MGGTGSASGPTAADGTGGAHAGEPGSHGSLAGAAAAPARPAAAANGPPEPIVFSHANGFPAAVYRVLFDVWRAAGHAVHHVDRIGHDPAFPVTGNWPRLRDELLQLIDRTVAAAGAGAGAPRVHLVGHSLGGYLSLMAASRRPQAVRSVVLLDSPVVGGWRAHSLRVIKLTGLMARLSPGKVSARRRWRWPDRDAVHAHFAAKKAFAVWDPRVLADYVACGFEPDPDAGTAQALRLAFSRETETRLYNTLPHHLVPLLARHPPAAPVTFIGGTRSPEVRQAGLAATRRIAQDRVRWIEGSHLFPMERPQETAQAVLAAMAAAPRG